MLKKDYTVFLVAVGLFGLTYGVYEMLIPFYLESRRVSFSRMGDIFAFSFLFAFLMRQYAGYLSDVLGRKPLFSTGLLLAGLGNFTTPFFGKAIIQAGLKSLREAAYGIKETMQSVILYEGDHKNFLNNYGKNRGVEWILQALGIFLAGMIASRFSIAFAFLLSGLLLFLATLAFSVFFQGKRTVNEEAKRLTVQEIFSFDLKGKLRYLTFVYFLVNVNTGLSHGPTMPLFFKDRFQMSLAAIAVLMVFHRLSLGLPMLLVGRVKSDRLKFFYMLTLTLGGASLVITPFIPTASVAIPVWLAHDLIGAGIWNPIHNYFTQKFAGEDIRGLHVSKSFAYGSLGTVFGYLLSGYLYSVDTGAPFVSAGLCAILTAVLVVKL